MIKYRDKRTTITIGLPEGCGHKGYSVDCGYSFDRGRKQYSVSMELSRDDTGDKQPIGTQYVDGCKKSIDYNIRRIIEASSLSGYFEEYIQKYEYTYKCFDKGNEFFEEETLPKNKPYPVRECKIVRFAYYCTKCGVYVEEGNECCPHCNAKLDWNSIEKDRDNDL